MPRLDLCIASIYDPVNVTASSGTPASAPGLPSLLDPETYDPEDVTNSYDFSKFYNSFYIGAF